MTSWLLLALQKPHRAGQTSLSDKCLAFRSLLELMTLWWGKNTCKWSKYLREDRELGSSGPGWPHCRGGAVREVCAKVKGSWEPTGWCWPGLPGTKTPETSARWFTPSWPTVLPGGNRVGREQDGEGEEAKPVWWNPKQLRWNPRCSLVTREA